MMQFTEEQKAALIEHIETELNVLRNVTLKHCDECERDDVERDIRVQEIALASLTARPKAFIEEKAPGRDKFILKGFYLHGLNLDDNLYTAPPAPALRLPDEIDGSRVAHVYLESTAKDKLDAYVMGANETLAKVKRLNATAPTSPDYSECPLCDSSYIAGMQAGFKFGDAGDNEGFNKAVNSRRKQISVSLNATTPQPVLRDVKWPELGDDVDMYSHAEIEAYEMAVDECKEALRAAGYQVED